MRISIALAVAVLAVSCAAPAPIPANRPPARELAGRVAGQPQRCVLIRSDQPLKVSTADRHMLIYSDGRTTWANDLGQCALDPDDILVSQAIGSSYCRGDLIRSIDRVSRLPGPACVLGEFVPYTK
jgi:hypothetical protein